MFVHSNITVQPGDRSGDASTEAHTGGVSSSHRPMSSPALATPSPVEPSTGTARQTVVTITLETTRA